VTGGNRVEKLPACRPGGKPKHAPPKHRDFVKPLPAKAKTAGVTGISFQEHFGRLRVEREGRNTAAGSLGETRARAGKSRLKGGWQPGLAAPLRLAYFMGFCEAAS
jgi:hypothetical protein